MLTSALEANLSLISVGQNEVMKKLAVWSAILAVPTMLAGISGMNFEFMPEPHWRYGYAPVMSGMAKICGLLFRWFTDGGAADFLFLRAEPPSSRSRMGQSLLSDP